MNIYRDGASKPDDVDRNIEEELPSKMLESMKPKSVNHLDPANKQGKMSNVFEIEINFPPNKQEKKEIDRINNTESLFYEGYALKLGEKCQCGFEYISTVNLGNCEST